MINENKFLFSLEEIPQGSKVVIYGTGDLGSHIYSKIKENRNDIFVVSFVDSFRNGSFHGTKVIKFDDFDPKELDHDILIIASLAWANDIIKNLESIGISEYLISLICNMGESKYFSDQWMRYKEEIDLIDKLLHRDSDKKLWRVVVNAMKNRSGIELRKWFVGNQGMPYLDFVYLSEGDVVIEGGVFDGTDTVRFSEKAGKSGKIYGFDILGDTLFRQRYDSFDLELGNIEIIPKALWKKRSHLYFSKNGHKSKLQTQSEKGLFQTEAISIDEFVAFQDLESVDYIKLDVEGAELDVLQGAEVTIQSMRPQLAVAVYHEVSHFFEIPLYLSAMLEEYLFRLQLYSPTLRKVVLYAIPKEIPMLRSGKR